MGGECGSYDSARSIDAFWLTSAHSDVLVSVVSPLPQERDQGSDSWTRQCRKGQHALMNSTDGAVDDTVPYNHGLGGGLRPDRRLKPRNIRLQRRALWLDRYRRSDELAEQLESILHWHVGYYPSHRFE